LLSVAGALAGAGDALADQRPGQGDVDLRFALALAQAGEGSCAGGAVTTRHRGRQAIEVVLGELVGDQHGLELCAQSREGLLLGATPREVLGLGGRIEGAAQGKGAHATSHLQPANAPCVARASLTLSESGK